MSNTIYTPYTYLIGWSSLNKYYYGVRYGKGCHPDELWVEYFTSSKRVKSYKEQYGDPDIIQIRKTFDNREDACNWEHIVLRKLKAPYKEEWLNQTDNKAIILTEEVIEGIRDAMIEHMKDPKNRARRASIGNKNGMYGRTHTPEARKKISEKSKELIHTKETKNQISESVKSSHKLRNGVFHNSIKISIEGKIYNNISRAEKALNATRHYIKKKLNSDVFSDWIIL